MTRLLNIHHSTRLWTRRPGFTGGLVAILAIGIAATTAMLSLIDAVLLRPLPWPDADRLVRIHAVLPERRAAVASATTWDRSALSWASWTDLRASGVLDEVGAWFSQREVFYGDRLPTLVDVTYASSSLFKILGARPVMGRLFTPDEDEYISAHAILPYATWQQRFGGRADILEQTVTLGASPESPGVQYQVVGVLPAEFRFVGESPEIVVPLGRMAWNGSFETNRFLRLVGRLARGHSPEAAFSVIEPLVRRQESPEQRTARVLRVVDDEAGGLADQLWWLLGAALLLQLVAASNVGGLLLNDAGVRRQEIAIRAALGATRAQVVRQFSLEYLSAAVPAAVLGVWLAWWMLPALRAWGPPDVAGLDGLGIDPIAAAVAVGLAIVTTIPFAVAPAFRLAPAGRTTLSGTGRQATSAGLRGHRLTVAMTLALTLAMVVSAGLFAETMRRLGARSVGFDPQGLTLVHIQWTQYPTLAAMANRPSGGTIHDVVADYERVRGSGWLHVSSIVDRLLGVPGVVGVAGIGAAPFSGSVDQVRILMPGARAEDARIVQRHRVSESYFDLMKIPIVLGRSFTDGDRPRRVAVVSRDLHESLFAGRAVGATFTRENLEYEIVGVAENVTHHDRSDAYLPAVYLMNRTVADVNYFVVRGNGNAVVSFPEIARTVEEADPFIQVLSVRSMAGLVADSMAEERLRGWVSGLFGATALVLAAIGLYGMAARFVSDRRKEIGIRMALGARPIDVRLFVFRDAAWIAVAGLAAGLPLAYGAARLVATFLYGVSADEPLIFALAAAVLTTAATVACLIPARRATSIDPIVALRE